MSVYERNPFSYRASEKKINDSIFLSLFEPKALDLLLKYRNHLWNSPVKMLSLPGSGKTTFLRLFTPESLMTLFENRHNEVHNELYVKVNSFQIFDNKPSKLGIYTSMVDYYLFDTNQILAENMKISAFYSLLMARLVISFLKGLTVFAGILYPNDLSEIKILKIPELNPESEIPTNCTGKELFSWASQLEKQTLDLNIYGYNEKNGNINLPNFHEIFHLFNPKCFLYNGNQLYESVLIMLDEVDTLSKNQINNLSNFLLKNRASNWWLSSRIESLQKDEIFKSTRNRNSRMERDFVEINLDEYWYNNKSSFIKLVKSIANRRINESSHILVSRFSESLQENLPIEKWKEIISNLKKRILPKVENIDSLMNFYKEQISLIDKKYKQNNLDTLIEKIILLRSIQILYDRKIRGSIQTTLIDSQVEEKPMRKISSAIRKAAAFKISIEEKIPYYFGLEKVSQVASNNIEQFLNISEKLFDTFLTNTYLNFL